MKKKFNKIFFLTASSSERIEYKTIKFLYDKINEKSSYSNSVFMCKTNNILEKIKNIIKTDIIVVHSALILSFQYILIAKILRKRIVGLVWDQYPVLIDGKKYDDRKFRIIADKSEDLCIQFCFKVLVPSQDFLKITNPKKLHVLHFWPPINIQPFNRKQSNFSELRIVFSGQVNSTRDLTGAVNRLKYLCKDPFKLIIATSDNISEELLNNECIENVGYLTSVCLQNLIQSCHFGLISLNKKLEVPGFPSKIFENIGAGIPSLYYGPRLDDYIAMLSTSGLGLDMDQLDLLNIDIYFKLIDNFNLKVSDYNLKACVNDLVVDDFIKIINS
jgi:hypothetical protein